MGVGCVGSCHGGRLCIGVVVACVRASLISFGMALNFCLNSLGVGFVRYFGFGFD